MNVVEQMRKNNQSEYKQVYKIRANFTWKLKSPIIKIRTIVNSLLTNQSSVKLRRQNWLRESKGKEEQVVLVQASNANEKCEIDL